MKYELEEFNAIGSVRHCMRYLILLVVNEVKFLNLESSMIC